MKISVEYIVGDGSKCTFENILDRWNDQRLCILTNVKTAEVTYIVKKLKEIVFSSGELSSAIDEYNKINEK